MGLVMLGVMFLYLLFAIAVVKLAIRYARNNDLNAKRWGLAAALIMYLIPFWDWVPTVVAHKYYCSKYGGFTIYKNFDDWKAENPGVAETLVPIKGVVSSNTENMIRYELNQRFSWGIIKTNKLLGIGESNNQIIDKKTGEILASFVDFSTNVGAIAVLGLDNIRNLKAWMKYDLCEPDAISKGKFYQFESLIERAGENKKWK